MQSLSCGCDQLSSAVSCAVTVTARLGGRAADTAVEKKLLLHSEAVAVQFSRTLRVDPM